MMTQIAKAYIWQRRFLGVLGITLPFLVLLFGLFGNNGPDWYYSISASAYTNAAPWFLTTMGAVGWFLIAYGAAIYREYSSLDFAINLASGIFALLISCFPCLTAAVERAGLIPLPIKTCSIIHNTSAAVFFFLLAMNILVLFTKSSGSMTKEKQRRNLIYRVCGIGILLFMAVQAYTSFFAKLDGPYTMANEAAMLFLFGAAWLVKGETLLKDSAEAQPA